MIFWSLYATLPKKNNAFSELKMLNFRPFLSLKS